MEEGSRLREKGQQQPQHMPVFSGLRAGIFCVWGGHLSRWGPNVPSPLLPGCPVDSSMGLGSEDPAAQGRGHMEPQHCFLVGPLTTPKNPVGGCRVPSSCAKTVSQLPARLGPWLAGALPPLPTIRSLPPSFLTPGDTGWRPPGTGDREGGRKGRKL